MRITKVILLVCLAVLLIKAVPQANAVEPIWNESEEQKAQRMAWWTDARFGMFLHWGTYSLAARHEWVKNAEQMNNEQYQKYFDHFNPDLFNPKEWAKAAKNAGMKYFVITTKHHEGFCLFDSKYTDYKVTNTPYGKDLVKQLADAYRAEGLKVGFYYSLIDWHHPDFTVDSNHPLRNNKEEREKNKNRNMAVYREYLYNQVRELMTQYGAIDCLFLDFSYPGQDGKGRDDWNSVELIKMIRDLQPNIVVNDRLDLMDVPGGWDFMTPEQYKPKTWMMFNGKKVPWETCQTFSGSWGYYRDEYTWKSVNQLLEMLVETVSKGGNLLLNVGPTGRGTFDDRATDRLEGMGKWMKYNNRAVYGCTQAPEGYKAPENSILTYNEKTKRLYISLLNWPMGELRMDNFPGKIKYAQMLHDASELKFSQKPGEGDKSEVTFSLPIQKPNTEFPVIELFLD